MRDNLCGSHLEPDPRPLVWPMLEVHPHHPHLPHITTSLRVVCVGGFVSVSFQLCNPREELKKRGIQMPRLSLKSTLRARLRLALSQEEEEEERTLQEAAAWKRWKMVRSQKVADANHVQALAKVRHAERGAAAARGACHVQGITTNCCHVLCGAPRLPRNLHSWNSARL